MKEAPSFQMYAEDFLTGVMYLTNEEVGVYIKMICKQWTDKKIPKKRLGLFVGIEWDDMSEELKSKFEDKGEYVMNARIENERTKKENFIKKQRENGKLGGRPPKKSKKQNPTKSQKKPLEEGKGKKEKGIKKEEVEYEIEVEKTFELCLDFFPDHLHPKDSITWLDTIDKLHRLDGLPYEKIIEITQRTRADDFWSKNFLSLTKLRKKNPEGIPYVVVFNEKIKSNGKQTGKKKAGYSQDFLNKIAQDLQP